LEFGIDSELGTAPDFDLLPESGEESSFNSTKFASIIAQDPKSESCEDFLDSGLLTQKAASESLSNTPFLLLSKKISPINDIPFILKRHPACVKNLNPDNSCLLLTLL
jgi:hypothetical protein